MEYNLEKYLQHFKCKFQANEDRGHFAFNEYAYKVIGTILKLNDLIIFYCKVKINYSYVFMKCLMLWLLKVLTFILFIVSLPSQTQATQTKFNQLRNKSKCHIVWIRP